MHLIQIITCISRDTCIHRTAIFMMAVIFFFFTKTYRFSNMRITFFEQYIIQLSSSKMDNIYNIGVLTVNIEFMCQGLETRKRQVLASRSIRFMPSHINSIFTVNTPILYLSCNTMYLQKKKFFNLIITKDN